MHTETPFAPFHFGIDYIREHFGSNTPLATQQITHNLYRSNPERLIDFMIRTLELSGQESLLDVGCGNGFILGEIVNRLRVGARAVGLDISPDMLALAKKNTAKALIPLTFVEGVAEDLSQYENARFDRVLANFIFHYVDNPDVVCRELGRVVQPHGFVTVSIEARHSMAQMYQLHFDAMHTTGFPKDFIDRLPTGRRGKMVQDNALEILLQHFEEVTEHPYVDTLVFESASPFLDFYAAGHRYLGAQAMASGTVSDALLKSLHAEVERRVKEIISLHGKFNLSKQNSIFVCRGAKQAAK